ncbi:hypothetical protein DPEC_G00274250 [Dallia pectoralis]|uniref:Uncharacterized protein n=1 Tax=Dallia pectoralis TaxID=75939 RepID=A0ACC2FKX2_DALPE|nr:hypothetical protein DPEC_G00274250 [Dallia pectoralis]
MYQSNDETGGPTVSCVQNNRCDVINTFHKGFYTMRQIPALPWNFIIRDLENDSSSEIILDILKQTCLHPFCRKYPPSVRYRRRFLSQLIKIHEASELDPLDGLYDAMGEVLCVEEGPRCYKTYLLPGGEAVTLSESVAVISEGTTGLVTWDAGVYLAEWALENTHLFTGRTVLELGSGVGLTGITVCRACRPSQYVFSDCHLSVLQRLRDNIQVNGLDNQNPPRVSHSDDGEMDNQNTPRVSVEDLDWESVTEEQLRVMGANMVIAADVVYDPEVIGCLVKLLSKILRCSANSSSTSDVYISSTIRNPDTYNSFKQHLANAGIQHEIIDEPVTQVFHYNRLSANIELIQLYI